MCCHKVVKLNSRAVFLVITNISKYRLKIEIYQYEIINTKLVTSPIGNILIYTDPNNGCAWIDIICITRRLDKIIVDLLTLVSFEGVVEKLVACSIDTLCLWVGTMSTMAIVKFTRSI